MIVEPIVIRAMEPADWPAVARIFEEGIATGTATFQTHAPTWTEWDEGHIEELRLVAELDGQVAGWTALSPVSSRCVYAGVAEVSVYVGEHARGAGVGHHLLSRLVSLSEASRFWTLQAGIMVENAASIRLHEKCGFRIVGRRERLGQYQGVWRDVYLMERRRARD